MHRSFLGASLVAQMVKNLSAAQDALVWSLGREDPLEKRMATDSSIPAWRIPWTEEPDGLQSMGSQRVGHHWATDTFTLLSGPSSTRPSLLTMPCLLPKSQSLGPCLSTSVASPYLSLHKILPVGLQRMGHDWAHTHKILPVHWPTRVQGRHRCSDPSPQISRLTPAHGKVSKGPWCYGVWGPMSICSVVRMVVGAGGEVGCH